MPQRAEEIEVPGPEWSAGAPEPVVVAREGRCWVAYYWEGDWTLEDPPRDQVAVLELAGCLVVKTGFPGDEVVHGHPLFPDGAGYAAYVVHDSEWIAELQRIEDHHPRAGRLGGTHYVLAFHDSMLEAVARELRPAGTFRSMPDAVTAMAAWATATPNAYGTT